MADLVYLMMKPAEYFFLLVLYLVDIKPETELLCNISQSPKISETVQRFSKKNLTTSLRHRIMIEKLNTYEEKEK